MKNKITASGMSALTMPRLSMQITAARVLRTLTVGAICVSTLAGCSSAGSFFNPFYETPAPVALLGDKNDRAISGGGQNEDTARKALEAMASYRRAQTPQPVDPVIQPAVVRLMWIPDHLNKNGDLVPPHYYYVRVLRDRWAVTDAFELEGQLGGGTKTSNMPFVHTDEARPERMQ